MRSTHSTPLTRVVLAPILALTLGLGTLACGDDAGAPVEASGTVEATEADLGFTVPGRLLHIAPREGDRVVEGDTLAALENREFQAAVASAQAQLESQEARLRELRSGARPQEIAGARAALEAAREQEDQARREAERAQRLHQGGALSTQALEQARTRLESAVASRKQAEESLDLVEEGPRAETLAAQEAATAQARAALERSRAALDETVLLAPFDGLVTVRHREPGEILGPGVPVLSLMVTDDRWVRIYVREDRIGRVFLGTEAEITTDSYPDRVFSGEVFFIGSEAEFTPRNVQTDEERTRLVYPVKVRITDDQELALKPGLPADVLIPGSGTDGP